ncbi:hypothetical protein BVG19_g1201 [[Candida] boidinii]|nr:hypothetical protein BVG19_g1201 [[Candida] boidinii]OWB51152.1 hypothetical protein B5S27_g2711 [[Candida] boidinii]OWB83221.1 hypothetical protein B5S33_g1850 [[Candida] boidinii]
MLEFSLLPDTLVSITAIDDTFVIDTSTSDKKSTLIFDQNNKPNHLDGSREVIILDSVKSGSSRAPKSNIFTQLIEPLFNILHIRFKYVAAESPKFISEFSGKLSDNVKYLIIFISGDTSINEFINGIESDKTLDITILNVPLGTGNAFSHSVGIHDTIDAMEKLLFGKELDLQLYNAKFSENSMLIHNGERHPIKNRFFFVVASWALHASLVAESDSPEMRQFGSARFSMAAQNILKRNPAYYGRLCIQDNVSDTDDITQKEFSYFVLAAVSRFEKQFVISPKSSALNSDLYLISFEYQSNPDDTMAIMKEAYDNGSHINNKKVDYKKITENETVELTILTSDNSLNVICVDGSIVELGGDRRLQVSFHGSSVHNTTLKFIA